MGASVAATKIDSPPIAIAGTDGSQGVASHRSAAASAWTKLLVAPLHADDPRGRGLLAYCEDGSLPEAATSRHPSRTATGNKSFAADTIYPVKDRLFGFTRLAAPQSNENRALVETVCRMESTALSYDPRYQSRVSTFGRHPVLDESIESQADRFASLTEIFPRAVFGERGTASSSQEIREYQRRATHFIDLLRGNLPIVLPESHDIYVAPVVIAPGGYLHGCLRFHVSDLFVFPSSREPYRTALSCLVRFHTKTLPRLHGVELNAVIEVGMLLPEAQQKTAFERTARQWAMLGEYAVGEPAIDDSRSRRTPGISGKLMATLTRFNVPHLRIRVSQPNEESGASTWQERICIPYDLKRHLQSRETLPQELGCVADALLPPLHFPIPISAQRCNDFVKSLNR